MTAYVFRPVVERGGVGRKTHMRETFHGFAPLFECVQAVQDEVIPETCHVIRQIVEKFTLMLVEEFGSG